MSLNINRDILDEIRSRCDIVDIVNSCGVQLRRTGSGGAFVGLCPFHQEKTPSFTVNQTKQMFYCFGCGKGGDVLRFFMDQQNLDFVTAVKILADRIGIIIPETDEFSVAVAHPGKNERDRMYAINAEFSKFFHQYLRDNPNSSGGKYLQQRGIPMNIAEKFKIGLSPDQRTVCRDYGIHLGFTENELITSGILQRYENRIYEPFQGRLMFTIENEQGHPVGFSGRTLEAHPDKRKYVNTTETPVFHKGSLIYALPLSRSGIGRAKQAILCEGQLDAIAFHRAGFEFAVAPLGTAFTAEQAKILRRYTRNIVLAFDSDNAGQNAVLKAAKLLLPLSMDLKVLSIPGGKDPDELYANGGVEAMQNALSTTVSWLSVLGNSLKQQFEMSSPVGRAEAVEVLTEYLELVTNQVELEVYINESAAMLNVSTEAISAEFGKKKKQHRRRQEFGITPAFTKVAKTSPQAAVNTLLELALTGENCARELSELLEPGELDDSTMIQRAVNKAVAMTLNGEYDQFQEELKSMLLETPSPDIARILISPADYPESMRSKALKDAITELRIIKRKTKGNELIFKMSQATSQEEKMNILREIGGLS